jgi:hypothetical protein
LARCLISSLNFLGAGTKTTFPWLQRLHHTRGASLRRPDPLRGPARTTNPARRLDRRLPHLQTHLPRHDLTKPY